MVVSERGGEEGIVTSEPVLAAVGSEIVAFFRKKLVPAVLQDGDMVKLTWPGGQEDFRLGLCLYDMEAIRSGGPGGVRRDKEDGWRRSELLLSLHFFAFANRKAAFHAMEAEDELLLLEAAARAVYAEPELEGVGGRLRLTLDHVEGAGKASLWQSMSAPSQPAVWFKAEPVAIPGGLVRRAPAVREVRSTVGRRKES